MAGFVYFTLPGATGAAAASAAPVLLAHGVAAGVLPYLGLIFTLAGTGAALVSGTVGAALLPGQAPPAATAEGGFGLLGLFQRACGVGRRTGKESLCSGLRQGALDPSTAAGADPNRPDCLHATRTALSTTRARPPPGHPRVPPRLHAAVRARAVHRGGGGLRGRLPRRHALRKGGFRAAPGCERWAAVPVAACWVVSLSPPGYPPPNQHWVAPTNHTPSNANPTQKQNKRCT